MIICLNKEFASANTENRKEVSVETVAIWGLIQLATYSSLGSRDIIFKEGSNAGIVGVWAQTWSTLHEAGLKLALSLAVHLNLWEKIATQGLDSVLKPVYFLM